MSTQRCPVTELLIDQCDHCRLAIPATAPTRDEVAEFLGEPPPKTIAARFDSHCPECDGEIGAGDEITLAGGKWVCDDCAS